MPHKKRSKARRKYLFGAVAIALIVLATSLAVFNFGAPKSRVWLIGLSSSGLMAVDADNLKQVFPSFLSKIPAASRYSFAADGDDLYIGLSHEGAAAVYKVSTRSNAVSSLTVSSTGDVRDLGMYGHDLYALVMDYASNTPSLSRISTETFAVVQSLLLKAIVDGIPYKMCFSSGAAYIVAYNSTSAVSSVTYISLPEMRNRFAVQVPVRAATKIDGDGERIYVRGENEVAVYTTSLEYVGKMGSIFGYGDLLCSNGKVYVAGASSSWKPAVYVLKTSPVGVERVIMLSAASGAALNLASKGSAVYALYFSTGTGCFLREVSESPSEEVALPNTENEYPTSIFFFTGAVAFGEQR